jgi:adenine phosphoribosyltransferase
MREGRRAPISSEFVEMTACVGDDNWIADGWMVIDARLSVRLERSEQFEGLGRLEIPVHDGVNSGNHGFRSVGLEDVTPHVDARRALLNGVAMVSASTPLAIALTKLAAIGQVGNSKSDGIGINGESMASLHFENDLRASIRSIPDYPKPGLVFRDITTLLGNARAFRRAVDELVQPWAGMKIDKVAGIEARGFILGGAVAHQVSAGFVPIRKKGKLPHKRVSIAYLLEYGLDEMEMHEDAVEKGDRVILVDDLIATGGTAEGAVKLLRQFGAQVLAACFIIDLPDLGGAAKLRELDLPVRTLIRFNGTGNTAWRR